MKQIQKRILLQVVLGFLLGRVSIFGLNPVGIAYEHGNGYLWRNGNVCAFSCFRYVRQKRNTY